MANNTKKLNLANINKENAKLHEMKAVTIHLDSGDSYSIDIYKRITPTMIDQTYNDTVSFLVEAVENNVSEKNLSIVTVQYMMLSFIEHSTSLKLPSEMDKRLAVLQKMYDLGIMTKIVAQFDEKESEGAFNKLSEMINNYTEQINIVHKDMLQAVKEHEEKENIIWEAGEDIAKINELDETGKEIENQPPLSDEEMDSITEVDDSDGDE